MAEAARFEIGRPCPIRRTTPHLRAGSRGRDICPQEYWSVTGQFETAKGIPFPARLTHLEGERLDRLAIKSEAVAEAAKRTIENSSFTVSSVEKETVRRNPAPPFTTSTLQQEASRKLRFGASRTMQIAQKLYEGIDIGGETVGLITYMRTDSVTLSSEASSAAAGG